MIPLDHFYIHQHLRGGHSRVVRDARFWCKKLLVDCKITPWFCHLTTGKLYHPAVNGRVLLDSVKDKAAEGEEWAPPFISCSQDKVGL